MIQPKTKSCHGTGAAKGHGCGQPAKIRKYGLGISCCYAKWLYGSEEGQKKINKAIIKTTKPKFDYDKAKAERDGENKLSNLLKGAKDALHAYIRQRDHGIPCISCGNPWHEDYQAGHFYKAELFSTLRFDEKNLAGQCRRCNLFNEGNESGYRVGILNRYGKEHLRYLDEKAQIEKQANHKWDADELRTIRKTYVDKLRNLIKNG